MLLITYPDQSASGMIKSLQMIDFNVFAKVIADMELFCESPNPVRKGQPPQRRKGKVTTSAKMSMRALESGQPLRYGLYRL